MSRTARPPVARWVQALWLSAALGVWAVLTTERFLELPGTPLRALFIVSCLFIASGAALWAARRLEPRWRYLPLLVLVCLGAREWQERARYRQYRAGAPLKSVGPAERLGHPVTTTDLVVRYYELGSRQLAVNRLRVVQLSDLHVTPALASAYYARVVELVAAQDPDLILLTGDYVSKSENIELMARVLTRPWHARSGVFAVLGNHDHWSGAARVRQLLESEGATFVTGRCVHLPLSVGRVAVCGTEAPWGPELPSVLAPTDLNLVLSHTPDNVYRLAELGASVVFSGHTHGGQVRIPGFGAVVVPSRYGRQFDEGHFRVAGSELFVNTGIGADFPPLRLYCPPEILVVDFIRH